MSLAIGYDTASGALVIESNGVFPARSLTVWVSPTLPGDLQINDLAGRSQQILPWQDLTDLAKTYAPASMADALAYLQGEFGKSSPSRPFPAPYPLSRAASFAIQHGLTYVPTTTILDPNGTEVDTDVIHAPGQTVLMFASPFTGTLYLG